MSLLRLFTSSNSNFIGCRNLLTARSSISNCDVQRASISSKTREKLGIPPPPKRPLTPYIRFVKELRPKVLQNQPEVRALDVVKILAKEWVHVDPDKKELWKKEFLSEMEVYLSEMKQYRESITPEQKAILNEIKDKKKKSRINAERNKRNENLGKPKKPMSGFLKYLKDQEAHKNPETSRSDHMKSLAEKWKSLPEEEREIYNEMSREEMKKYKIELAAWEENMIRQGNVDVVRVKELLESKPVKKNLMK